MEVKMSIFAASVSQEVVDDFIKRIKDAGIGLSADQEGKVLKAFVEALVACGNGIDIHHPDKIATKVAKTP
jgi:hypothetical protein